MRRVISMLGLAAVLVAPAAASSRQDAGPEAFARQMVGTDSIDRGQRGDEHLSGEALEGTVRVTRKRIGLRRADGSPQYAARYTVDEVSNTTAKLTLETVKVEQPEELQTETTQDVGTTGKALATLDTGTLTIIYDTEGDASPDGFEPDNQEQHLFVLKKKEDDTSKKADAGKKDGASDKDGSE